MIIQKGVLKPGSFLILGSTYTKVKVIYFKRVSQVTLLKLLAFRLYPKQVKSFRKSRTKRKPSLSWTKRRKNNWKKSNKRLEENHKTLSSEPKLQKWNAEKSKPFAEDSAKNGFLMTRKHKASFCRKLKDWRVSWIQCNKLCSKNNKNCKITENSSRSTF